MILENTTAIVYGAAGAIGSAVARAYAREGAEVHLAGRTEATLETVAQRIRGDGGAARVTRLDVLDRAAVERHTAAVADANGIDICFNATSNDDVQGTPLLDLPFDDFLRPVTKAVTAHINIATAVGRHMIRRGGGVILVMAGGREAIPRLGGSHVAGRRSPDSAANSPQSSDRTAFASPGCSHPARRARTTAGTIMSREPRACWLATSPATTRSPTSPSSPPPTGPAPSPPARSTSPAARSSTDRWASTRVRVGNRSGVLHRATTILTDAASSPPLRPVDRAGNERKQ
jgi:NAD(P)-dependent dehydrogenase (short-subunit alcohol dehydrogenase family)